MPLPVVAVFDANVLYAAPVRDLLIRVAQAGLVRARWTDAIHDEWIRNLLIEKPRLSPERLARTRALMNDAVRDCLVVGYEELIDSLNLPDANDRHVLAAALRAGAEVIVTYNLADFPDHVLSGFGIVALHPDDFLIGLIEQASSTVCAAVKRQREALRNPPQTPEQLLHTLERHGLVQTIACLREFVDLL